MNYSLEWRVYAKKHSGVEMKDELIICVDL